ncbi:hypothetical protein ACFVXH_39620 [Kitasatospora sp. NPDC058184]|uniref:hypothetical protein n=1 Tax=Kitasatospora sp. NPDC058184 TaxID=3346370 RepID=UPI0036DDDE1E
MADRRDHTTPDDHAMIAAQAPIAPGTPAACDRTDDAHDGARTQIHTENVPEQPDGNQLPLL